MAPYGDTDVSNPCREGSLVAYDVRNDPDRRCLGGDVLVWSARRCLMFTLAGWQADALKGEVGDRAARIGYNREFALFRPGW